MLKFDSNPPNLTYEPSLGAQGHEGEGDEPSQTPARQLHAQEIKPTLPQQMRAEEKHQTDCVVPYIRV